MSEAAYGWKTSKYVYGCPFLSQYNNYKTPEFKATTFLHCAFSQSEFNLTVNRVDSQGNKI